MLSMQGALMEIAFSVVLYLDMFDKHIFLVMYLFHFDILTQHI